MKNPADFVGSALGESEKNTKAILDASVGKVLVIDEASAESVPLDSNPADCSPRRTVCMEVAGKVEAVRMTRTRPRSSTRSLRRFRVCRVRTDAFCSLVIRTRWKKCSR